MINISLTAIWAFHSLHYDPSHLRRPEDREVQETKTEDSIIRIVKVRHKTWKLAVTQCILFFLWDSWSQTDSCHISSSLRVFSLLLCELLLSGSCSLPPTKQNHSVFLWPWNTDLGRKGAQLYDSTVFSGDLQDRTGPKDNSISTICRPICKYNCQAPFQRIKWGHTWLHLYWLWGFCSHTSPFIFTALMEDNSEL